VSTLNNPHDRFFREVFSRREIAVDFVRHYLPPEVIAHFETATLSIIKDSFVDSDLQEHFSDLLYQTRLKDGGKAYIYVLFEHKSYPEPWVALQLLRYMVRVWEQVLKQEKAGHLPSIVPVVVYHGAEDWKIDRHFRSLFVDRLAFAGYIPDFRYQLCDLSDYSDEEIVGEVTLRVTLLILKHIFDGNLGERLPEISSLLRELAQARSALKYLEVVLRYLTAAATQLDKEELQQMIENTFPQPLPGSLAEEWIGQGVEQGIEQGIDQGIEQGIERGVLRATREAVLDILETRFATLSSTIAVIIAEIDDLSKLRELRKRALTVSSLAEFQRVLETYTTRERSVSVA
jgi:predicted transposase/invertase (TIGR01784 family)